VLAFVDTLPRRAVVQRTTATLGACAVRARGENRPAYVRAGFPLDENTRSLISRALEQDREAIDVLFTRYRDRLRAALRKLIGPKYRLLLQDSEDAAQDAILSALKRLHQFEYRGDGSFLAWLLKGAEYEIVRRIRGIEAKKRNPEGGFVALDTAALHALPAEGDTPSQILDEQELAERVREALQQLPDREREVIMLRRFLELDNDEICVEMGLPTTGSVRALLSRAQARLSGLLSKNEEE
jgi:RNA polymerase sigma-70 factor (ECF subfamily)